LPISSGRRCTTPRTSGSASGLAIAREFLNKSEKVRSRVVSAAMSFLGLYSLMTAKTARCDGASRIAWMRSDFDPSI
jgi:hypothetical protein